MAQLRPCRASARRQRCRSACPAGASRQACSSKANRSTWVFFGGCEHITQSWSHRSVTSNVLCVDPERSRRSTPTARVDQHDVAIESPERSRRSDTRPRGRNTRATACTFDESASPGVASPDAEPGHIGETRHQLAAGSTSGIMRRVCRIRPAVPGSRSQRPSECRTASSSSR